MRAPGACLALALTVTSGTVVHRRGRPAREEAAAFAAVADAELTGQLAVCTGR